jgi:hypothetical protein
VADRLETPAFKGQLYLLNSLIIEESFGCHILRKNLFQPYMPAKLKPGLGLGVGRWVEGVEV